jgi:hypothetical protein
MLHRKVAYNYGTALYEGDVMVDIGSGYCRRYISGDAGSNVLGTVKGFEYLSSATGRKTVSNYLPAGDTAYDVEVQLQPIMGVGPQLFLVQSLSSSTYFTKADIGQNMEPTVSGTGSIVGGYGKSAMGVTQGGSLEATTATFPFRIVGLYSEYAPTGTPGTDDTSPYNIIVVQSNPFNVAGI